MAWLFNSNILITKNCSMSLSPYQLSGKCLCYCMACFPSFFICLSPDPKSVVVVVVIG